MGEVGGIGPRPRVLVLVGPTAAGKTPTAVELALRLGGEVVSADARQVYRLLDIGTAKPTREERARVPHHVIDILDPREDYNAGQYGQDAARAIKEIVARGRVPIVTGGSGLYVRAVVDGLFEGPGRSVESRDRWEEAWRRRGEDGLRKALQAVDPETERTTERGKPRRLIRALEEFEESGIPLSEHHRRQRREVPFEFVQVGITPPREELYRRIERRACRMIEEGLVDEVRDLRNRGYDLSLNSLNTVGYREVFQHFDGELDQNGMLHAIQTHTRQYAKRQLTWFRADDRIRWIEGAGGLSPERVAERVLSESWPVEGL